MELVLSSRVVPTGYVRYPITRVVGRCPALVYRCMEVSST